MNDRDLVKKVVIRYLILVGIAAAVCLMARLARADKPPVAIPLGGGLILTYEEAKQCTECYRSYSKCVASVLTGTAPTAEVMEFIGTCKTLEAKCTKDYECLNSN